MILHLSTFYVRACSLPRSYSCLLCLLWHCGIQILNDMRSCSSSVHPGYLLCDWVHEFPTSWRTPRAWCTTDAPDEAASVGAFQRVTPYLTGSQLALYFKVLHCHVITCCCLGSSVLAGSLRTLRTDRSQGELWEGFGPPALAMGH